MDNVSSDELLSIAWRRWGIIPKRTGDEFHGPCPRCGGTDRFIIFPDGGYMCRPIEDHCGMRGWLDDDKPYKIDPAELAARKARDEARRRQEEIEKLDKLKAFQEGYASGYIQGWHDAMSAEKRGYWRSEGISDHAIDLYQLGYDPQHKIRLDGKLINSPAFTIPVREPKTWDIINIEYRLECPPPGAGKYRQQYDLDAASFYADDRTEGDAVVVEGAKKSIIVHEFTDAKIQVVGLPGCSPAQRLIDDLKEFDRVWVWLDPGAERQAAKIARQLKRARVITCAWKPDDSITKGKLSRSELHSFLDVARFN